MRCCRLVMCRPRSHRIAAAVIGATLALTTWGAIAARPISDRAEAERILQTQPSASSASSGPRQMARAALERADRARASGDDVNAGRLEALGREWAELARDTETTADAERSATAAQSAAASAATRVKRARALLEEQMSRRARAEGELRALRDAADAGVASAVIRPMVQSPRPAASSARSRPAASGSQSVPSALPGVEP